MKARRLMAGLTASCLMMAALSGGAASADSVAVTADRLNMRKEADASSKAISVLTRGEELSFVSQNGDWLQIKDGSKTGFVMREYVKLDLTQLESDVESNTERFDEPKSARAAERVNLRKLPMTDSDIVKVVQKNNAVSIVGQCGDWYHVEFGGKTGYIAAQYLTLDGQTGSGESSSAVLDNLYDQSKSGRTTTRVNLRKSPSTSASIVSVVDKNGSVTVLGENSGWYKISCGGHEGYISQAYVTLTASSSGSTDAAGSDSLYAAPVTAQAVERVNLRKSPSTSASILKVVAASQSVSVLGENGSWYKVSFSGREGYIAKNYLRLDGDGSDAVVPDGFTSYPAARSGYTTDRVNMRAEASSDAKIAKVLNKNVSVSLLGEQGGFYQVKYDSTVGYISKAYVALGPTNAGDSSSASDTLYSQSKAASTTVQVNMRKEPEGEVLFRLPKGTAVTLLGERGGWYKVSYSQSIGYISKDYVQETASAPEQPDTEKPTETVPDLSGKGTTAYITADSLNMRKGPGTGYGIVKVLKKADEIQFYSLSDGWYLIKADGDTGYVSSKYVSTTKPDVAPSNPGGEQEKDEVEIGKVQMPDWWTSDIQKIFKVGVIATVTDVDTGLSWQVKRSGGTNHADVQPLTAADTATMFKAYNNKWSWDRHAIWVTIDGVSYAASMNGMPHGTGSITTNNFDGHHCIHFLNSRTHTGNRWDTAHQSMVQKAYKAGQ